MKTFIFTCACIALCIASQSSRARGAVNGGQDSRKVVRIVVERFRFTPDVIRVRRGQTLELHLESDDTDHGFHVVGTEINRIIPKRGRGELVVTVTLDSVGRHAFECSKVCGAGHEFMHGVIVVEE